jgi:hypothetical protein
MIGHPKRKPRIKCKKCNKHYIPSEQIKIMCGYFSVDENPFCKKCLDMELLTLEPMRNDLKIAEEAFNAETDPTKKQELKKTIENIKEIVVNHLKQEEEKAKKQIKKELK